MYGCCGSQKRYRCRGKEKEWKRNLSRASGWWCEKWKFVQLGVLLLLLLLLLLPFLIQQLAPSCLSLKVVKAVAPFSASPFALEFVFQGCELTEQMLGERVCVTDENCLR